MKTNNETKYVSQKRKLCALTLGTLISLGVTNANALTTASNAQTSAPNVQVKTQAPAQQEQAQIQELQEQFVEINQQISAIQQQAIQDETVKAKQRAYVKAVESALVEANPQLGELVEQQEALLSDIRGSGELDKPVAERSPELMQQVQQYQQIEQKLAPQRQQVAQDSDVAEAGATFQRVLIAQMKEIDPRTAELINTREQLVQQYQQMQ